MKALAFLALLLLPGCVNVNVPEPTPPATESAADATTTSSSSPTGRATPVRPTSTTTSSPPAPAANNSSPAVPVGPREWGDIDGKQIRPGINVGGCTSNFLFHVNHLRYFLGTAGHCFTENTGLAEACLPPSGELGQAVEISHRDAGTTQAALAYSSNHLMHAVGETDYDACWANDFALLELPAEALDLVHPAVLYYGGPTSLLTSPLPVGSDVYLFGYSGTRTPIHSSVRQELTSPMSGTVKSHDYDDWLTWSDLVGTIDGDSGAGLLGPNGEAQGTLAMGLPTETGTSNIAFALDYMRQHLGWAPELVTWADFSPTGIEPLRLQGQPVPP